MGKKRYLEEFRDIFFKNGNKIVIQKNELHRRNSLTEESCYRCVCKTAAAYELVLAFGLQGYPGKCSAIPEQDSNNFFVW